ncbi:MAG: hypothetical protein HY321_15360 [Armatimonadetes bacterium]|nr:hypothetical protein [Armatimonadota bacterium]
MNRVKQPPEFQTESEEARWYYDHRNDLEEYLELEDETDVPLHVRLGLPARRGGGLVRVPISAPDMEHARRLAADRGLSLQALVRRLLHEAIEREEAQPLS